MKNWKKLVVIALLTWMIMVVPAIAAPATEKTVSEFTHYKVGVQLSVDGGASKEIDQNGQSFHIHGKIPNAYNIVGIQNYKFLQQFDLWFWKLSGFLEVAQEELR